MTCDASKGRSGQRTIAVTDRDGTRSEERDGTELALGS